MRWKLPLLIGMASGSLILSGCHKSAAEETSPVDNSPVVQEEEPAANAVPETEAEPPATNNSMAEAPKPAAPKIAPPPELSADQQMMEDAASTGMTARVDRNGEGNGDAAQGETNEQQ